MASFTKAASSNAVVTTGWTNPTNAYGTTADSVYATAAPAKNATVSTDYGFAITAADIPAGSLVTSVVATVSWKVSTTTAATLGVQIRDNGVALGTETTFSSTTQTVSSQTVTSGVTQADIVGGLVVARVRDTRGNSTTSHTGSLDFCSLTVNFTPPTTYTDSPAGAAAATGSLTDSWAVSTVYTDAPSGTAAASGTRTDSLAAADGPTGAAAATGTVTGGVTYTNSPTGSAAASGTATSSLTLTDAPTGTASAAGTLADTYTPGGTAYTDTPAGTGTATGTLTATLTYTDASGGTAQSNGSIAVTAAYTELPAGLATAIGTITRTTSYADTIPGQAAAAGTLADSYQPAGGTDDRYTWHGRSMTGVGR